MFRWAMQTPEAVSPEDRRAYHVAVLAGLVGLVMHIFSLAVFAVFGLEPLVYINIGSVTLFAAVFLHVRLTGVVAPGMALASTELVVHQVAAVYYLGWDYGFQYFLFPIATFAFMGHYRSRAIHAFFASMAALSFAWLYLYGQHLRYPHLFLPAPVREVWFLYNAITAIIGLAVMALIYARTAIVMERELREAQLMLVQSEKMAALGKLAAGLTHEINTPIGAMISNAQTGARAVEKLSAEGLSDAKQARLLRALAGTQQSTAEAARRLKVMVARLQGFVRIDEAEEKTVDLHQALDDILALLQNQLQEGSVEVVRRYADDLPELRCRPAEINQVLMHLLQNAIDAMDGPGDITVSTGHDAEQVTVTVSDTGRGMEQEDLGGPVRPGLRLGPIPDQARHGPAGVPPDRGPPRRRAMGGERTRPGQHLHGPVAPDQRRRPAGVDRGGAVRTRAWCGRWPPWCWTP